MDLLSSVTGFAGSAAGYILPFLFVLTIVVFIHEFGHFYVGRRCGVEVKTFSVGFGPELAGFNDRHGTRWRFAAIPLGGYVKFFGDANGASVPDHESGRRMSPEERARSFLHQPVAKRAAIVAAGPIANFLLAVVIFTGMAYVYGAAEPLARVGRVVEGGAAAAAGMRPGDLVRSIDGQPVETFTDMQRIIAGRTDRSLTIVVERDGQEVTLQATPQRQVIGTAFGKQRIVGLGIRSSDDPKDVRRTTYGPLGALGAGLDRTWFVVERTGAYVVGLFAGRESTDQLSGPIRIAQVSGVVAAAGFAALLNLAAVLSVSIGLINLVPVPLLDGGHLLFYAVEAVRGRPLSERAQEFSFRIGFAIVVLLMLFTTFNDVLQLSSS